jgi:hypothetical protein
MRFLLAKQLIADNILQMGRGIGGLLLSNHGGWDFWSGEIEFTEFIKFIEVTQLRRAQINLKSKICNPLKA